MFCSFFLVRIGLHTYNQCTFLTTSQFRFSIFSASLCRIYMLRALGVITLHVYLFVCFYKGGEDSMLSSKTFIYFLYSVFFFFSSCYYALKIKQTKCKKKLPHLVYMLCCMHRSRLAVLTSSQSVPRGFFFIYCAASSSERVITTHSTIAVVHTAQIYIYIYIYDACDILSLSLVG